MFDEFPDDPDEWADTDGDGVGDESDAFPEDSSEQVDTDEDGFGDNTDHFPFDNTEWIDTDGDGVGDNSDAFPMDTTEQLDSDGDGVGDESDAFPMDSTEQLDTDGDGCGDNSDLDPNDRNVTTCGAVTIVEGGTKKVELYGFEFDWRTMAVIALSIVIIVLGWLYYKSKAMAPEAIDHEQLAIELTTLQLEEDDSYGAPSHQPQARLFLQGDSKWTEIQCISKDSWKTFGTSHLDDFFASVSKVSSSPDATHCAKYVRASLTQFMRHVVKFKSGTSEYGMPRELNGFEGMNATGIVNAITKERRRKKSLKNEWGFGRAPISQIKASHLRSSEEVHPEEKYLEYSDYDAEIAAQAVISMKDYLDL